jgi:hypothetical protein
MRSHHAMPTLRVLPETPQITRESVYDPAKFVGGVYASYLNEMLTRAR